MCSENIRTVLVSQNGKSTWKTLTRTLIILPMLRLAGSATSFSLVAAFMRLSHDGRWLRSATKLPQAQLWSVVVQSGCYKNHTFRCSYCSTILVLLAGFLLFAVDEEKLAWNSSKNFICLPVNTTEDI